MRHRRRTLATVLTLLFAALSWAAPAQERTTILVWGMGFGPDSKGLEAVVREFERLHPEYEIRMLSMGAGNMNPQKLMTAIVGNVPPDVIHQDRFTLSDWANRGAFRPLDDLLERDKGKPFCPSPEDYYPATWHEAKFNGKVYGIPTGADNRVLYWNRAAFRAKAAELRAAGLDPERAPRTWSETLKYSEILTERNPNGSIKKVGFLPNYGNSWLYMYAFQNDAKFMSEDGTKCTLYSPEAEEALQFMVDGYDIIGGYEQAMKFQSTFAGGENDPFMIGTVAMKIDGDWILPGINRYKPGLDFGVAPPPVPDDRYNQVGRFAGMSQFITWTGGYAYAIPYNSKNVEGAWAWIKFATSLEGRMTESRAQAAWERQRGRQFVPNILAHRAANEQRYSELRPSLPNIAAGIRQHIDLMEFAHIRPATFVAQELWNEHVRAVEQAALKKDTPKEALLDGQAKVQRSLDEDLQRHRYPVIDLRLPALLGAFGALIGITILVVGFKRHRLGRLAKHEALWAYLFVAPWLFGFFVFTLGPMIASLFFSFTQYNILTDARWVGFKNYNTLITQDHEILLKAFYNVTYLGGIGVPLGLVSGLAVALLLNTGVRGMRYYRTLFYMPAIVPGVASVILWIWILSPDPTRGLVNAGWSETISQWFGVQPPGWMSVEAWAKPSLIFMGLWGAGAGMILWLAGLKGIPSTLYEAAAIDGASPKQQFWTVTVPMLSPIIFFNTVMGFIGSIQEFDRAYIAAGGQGGAGPADALLMPVLHLFVNGFNYFRMGYASALAWIIFGILMVLTFIQFKLAPKWVHYEADTR